MLAAMEVLGSVLVLGRIAATHVAAFQAKPQMDPCISGFDAVFTDMLVCAFEFDLIEMSAFSHNILR